jgi:hypothetical protein
VDQLICSPVPLHRPRECQTPGKFGVEIAPDEFRFFEQPDAFAGLLRSRLAAKAPVMSDRRQASAGDRPEASETPRQTPDQVVDEGAAEFARQTVKSRMRRTAENTQMKAEVGECRRSLPQAAQ